MNDNYQYKYKKYKSKYYKLKNIMKGGNFDGYISKVNMIVRKNLKYFMDLCKLDYEVGGFFNIKKQTFKKTVEGTKNAYHIDNMVSYPFYETLKIDWHTHQDGIPQIFDENEKQVKLDHPWINVAPSGTDYGSHSVATIFYKKNRGTNEIVISCIISSRGLYFYWMQDELSKFLLDEPDNEEVNKIIYEYLVPNLDNDTIEGMKKNSITKIQKLTQRSFTTADNAYGFNSIFIPFF
jgi:hypothetical protein